MSQGLNNDIAVSKTRRVVKNLRWWVLVLFLLGVTVNYITRNSLGIIAPELKATLGITTEQYSWIVGAFQLAYTIFQPLCGWLIDVIGLKLGFMICATLWALACIAHAGAGSWLHLAMLRFFMGGAEAAATPANAKTIGEWFPKSERPIAAGWAGVGFSIGAMLAPPIIYFAHASFGWQGAFMFTGALALLWVVLWWAFYQTPEKHPNLSKSELEYIKQDNEAPPVKQPFFTALKTVSKNKRFYGIAIPAFMAEPAWAVLSFWVPLYLAKEHGMDLKQIAMFAWLPFLAADLGSVVSGVLHDVVKSVQFRSVVSYRVIVVKPSDLGIVTVKDFKVVIIDKFRPVFGNRIVTSWARVRLPSTSNVSAATPFIKYLLVS